MAVTPSKATINSGNFKLNYSIEGEGPDVLVIGSSIYYPRTFSQNLRKRLRLIFVDHRGFAAKVGNITSDQFTLDVILEDIEKIRKQLELTQVILVGHSGHGYMAIEYAKKYPEFVSHLVLLAMSPDSSPESFAAADRYFQESVCPERKKLLEKNLATLQADIESEPDQAFITRSLKFSPMIWYDPYFDASPLWQDVKVNPDIMDYLWGKVFREIDITKNLAQFNMPVFLGLGRYDYWNPPFLWEKVRSNFNNLTICVFEKSGHTPQLEEAEQFDIQLLRWLDKNK